VAPGDDRIKKYYLFRAVTSFSLWMPFWTLWVYKNVDSKFLLTVVDIAFWTAMIAFQIPAGLLGDKYGRKKMLIIGEMTYAVGILCFGLGTQFWQLFGANIVWAIGVCFIVSGDTPFLYDTLLELGRAKQFIHVLARSQALMATMTAVACVVGGVMVQWVVPGHIELTLIIASMTGLAGSFTVFLLKEPKVERKKVASYVVQFKEGWKHVINSRAIIVLIMFQIVIEIAVYVMAVFRSVYMEEDLRLDLFWIGVFTGSFTLFGAFIAFQAGKIEGRLGEKKSLLFLLLAIVSSFVVVFLVNSPIVIGIQFLIYTVSYLQSPIISGYINRRVDSAHRSTVVAIASMLFTIFLTLIELPSGWFATHFGTRETLLVLAVAISPVALWLLVLWNREVDVQTQTHVLKEGTAGPEVVTDVK